MQETITQTKICTKCKEEKSLMQFSKDKKRIDGVQPHCKQCMADYYKSNKEKITYKKREYNKINKEQIYLQTRKYRELNKEKIRIKKLEYEKINKDTILLRKKEYREKNKQEINLKKRNYYRTPKGNASVKNISHKRRALKNNGDVTKDQLLELQQNAKVCYWCNQPLKNKKVHIDHYIPLAKGGLHAISNLVISCSKCNISKGAKDPEQFANKLGRLL